MNYSRRHLVRSFLLSLVLLVEAVAAAPADDVLSELRLSGVILVGGEPRLAVIEHSDGGGHTVRPGDKLRGVGVVAEIGKDWVRIDTGDEERELRLSALPADMAPGQGEPRVGSGQGTAQQAGTDAESEHAVTATPEIMEALSRSEVGTGDADLSLALIPVLGLSGDAQVKPYIGKDGGDESQVARVRELLARGEPVKLLIEENDRERITYLFPEGAGPGHAEEPAAEDDVSGSRP